MVADEVMLGHWLVDQVKLVVVSSGEQGVRRASGHQSFVTVVASYIVVMNFIEEWC